jgi:hypothetical protein
VLDSAPSITNRQASVLNKSETVTLGRAAVLLVVVASINALVSILFATAYVFATPSDPTAGYALCQSGCSRRGPRGRRLQ